MNLKKLFTQEDFEYSHASKKEYTWLLSVLGLSILLYLILAVYNVWQINHFSNQNFTIPHFQTYLVILMGWINLFAFFACIFLVLRFERKKWFPSIMVYQAIVLIINISSALYINISAYSLNGSSSLSPLSLSAYIGYSLLTAILHYTPVLFVLLLLLPLLKKKLHCKNALTLLCKIALICGLTTLILNAVILSSYLLFPSTQNGIGIIGKGGFFEILYVLSDLLESALKMLVSFLIIAPIEVLLFRQPPFHKQEVVLPEAPQIE